MPDEVTRSVALIERLLADSRPRAEFLRDPTGVLAAHAAPAHPDPAPTHPDPAPAHPDAARAHPDASGTIHRVGLPIEDGRFLTAPQPGEDVRIDSLSEPYFGAQYAGAPRYREADTAMRSHARTLPALGG